VFTPKPINENHQQMLVDLVEKNTGLSIRVSERDNFIKKIQDRMKTLNISHGEDYYCFLNRMDRESENEWKELAILITNTESYFFRDKGQFLLLKNHLFPELIKRKKSSRSLKIWSAGCSTGEEPYSLGILLQELIPDIETWDIKLLATDLNKNAIIRAKQGIYSPWSFRSLDQDIINKYFHKINSDYQINSTIRQMTQFEILNLKNDEFPQINGLINNLDLIICRNVFIYFSKESIALVVNKFINSLSSLGYLLTGHAELYGQTLTNLETKIFSESIVYQKPDPSLHKEYTLFSPYQIGENQPNLNILDNIYSPPQKQTPSYLDNSQKYQYNNLTEPQKYTPKTQLVNPVNPPQKTSTYPHNNQVNNLSESNLLTIAQEQFQKKQYKIAMEIVDQVLNLNQKSLTAYYLKAKILANMAQYHEAKKYCKKIITLDSFYLKAYYLLAQISEETQDIEKAKNLFKKIIYLDNSAITAYVGMAYIYRQESNFDKSKKMYQTALSLAKKMNPDLTVEGHHLTSRELCLQIEKELKLLET
jgi:chemotaxis protein methyltransferase CheR